MNTARHLGTELGHPKHTGTRFSFFNDYSAAVVRKCKVFDDVTDRMKKMIIDYALLYSVTLKKKVHSLEKGFDTPEAAALFLDLFD